MINRFSTMKKSLRIVFVFSVMMFGMCVLSACDSAEDLVKSLVDIDFEKAANITLKEVTAEKLGTASIQAAGDDCGSISVAQALEDLKAEIEDLDLIDIESVELNYVNASYKNASWTPNDGPLTCRLSITGTQRTEIAETAVSGASGEITVNLTDDQINVINYYLANRNETFNYCLECDGDTLDSYYVTYAVDINVLIKGNF